MTDKIEERRTLFKSMIIDESEWLEEVIRKAKEVILLDSRGQLLFQRPKKSLNNKQLVGLHLLGLFISEGAGIADRAEASTDELAMISGIDSKSVRARLSDLKKQGIVESPERGLYRITVTGASRLLDEILESSTTYQGTQFDSV